MRSLEFTKTEEPEPIRPIPAEIFQQGTSSKWNHTSSEDQIPVGDNSAKQVWMVEYENNVGKFYFTDRSGVKQYVSYKEGGEEITLEPEDKVEYQRNFTITYHGGHLFHPATKPQMYLSNKNGVLSITDDVPTPWYFGAPRQVTSFRSSHINTVAIRDAISSTYWENERIQPGLRLRLGNKPDAWQLIQCSGDRCTIEIPGYGMHVSALGDFLVFAAKGPNPCNFKIISRQGDTPGLVIFEYLPEQSYVYASSNGFLRLTPEIAQATAFVIHVSHVAFDESESEKTSPPEKK